MNRQQRRKMAKMTKNSFLLKALNYNKKQEYVFKDGDKVKLICKNLLQDRKSLSPEYIKFVEDSKDKVFTVKNIDKFKLNDIVGIEEDERWYFACSCLEGVSDEK